MKTFLMALLVLSSFASSQEPIPESPQMDSVTVTWDAEAKTGHIATLNWSEGLPEPPGIKVNRYRVYRALGSTSDFKLRGGTSQGITTYKDQNVISGKTYWYCVTALATNGVESGPSDKVAVTIP